MSKFQHRLPKVNRTHDEMFTKVLSLEMDTVTAELFALAVSDDYKERQRVAENPEAPHILLDRLAYDSDERVRLSVAENPRVPFVMLMQFLQDPSADVRYALAENHSMPISLLQHLSKDENPYISQRAKQTMMSLIRKDNVVKCDQRFFSAQRARMQNYI